ncbi:MAG: adenylate kinase family protein [Nanoarchaeota archaeon]
MKSEKIALIVLGAPGSGKGTQGKFLEEKTGFKKYVMSDLIRTFVKEGSEIFDKMKKGRLLNDLDIFQIFKKGFKFEEEVILDGIPRSVDQAYWFYGFFKIHGYNIKVIYLEVNEERLIDRILKRAKLENRIDDNKEVFINRMKEYNNAKNIVLDVFSDEIIKINGDGSIENISKDILNKLNLN